MKHDNDDTPGQHSATELQPRRLVVPEPAAYAPDKRLDVIHEPNLDVLSRGPQRAPRTPTSTTDWPGLQSFQQLNGDLAPTGSRTSTKAGTAAAARGSAD